MAKKRSPQRFEDLLGELEAIVASLEREELDLEGAVEAFERGMALSRECHRRLDEADRRVRIFREGADDEGEGEPFGDDAGDGAE